MEAVKACPNQEAQHAASFQSLSPLHFITRNFRTASSMDHLDEFAELAPPDEFIPKFEAQRQWKTLVILQKTRDRSGRLSSTSCCMTYNSAFECCALLCSTLCCAFPCSKKFRNNTRLPGSYCESVDVHEIHTPYNHYCYDCCYYFYYYVYNCYYYHYYYYTC